MYKQLEIDLFLKKIQLLSQKYVLTPAQIYAQLINFKIPEKEQNINMSNVFPSLIEKNKLEDKMWTLVSKKHTYYCQFISKNIPVTDELNPIKIYVSLKSKNIDKMIQKIFTFINENDIVHYSKLSKKVRVDDLVIRVYDKEDANKIINYINGEKELLNNMYNPSLFCINEGKVGMTMDRNLSYNDILSKYIFNYIKLVNSKQDFASNDGFKEFLKSNLNELSKKDDLSLQIKMCDERDIRKLPLFLHSLEEITKIIIGTLEGKNKEDLFHYYQEINKKEYNDDKNKEYKDFDYLNMTKNNNDLLKDIFLIIAKKNGYNNAKRTLELYRDTKDINYITNTNGMREKVINSKTFMTYLKIIDLDNFIKELIPKVDESQIKTPKEIILEEICKETYIISKERNYDTSIQIATALIQMQAGNYNYITRRNKARTIAKENIKPNEVEKIIRKSLESKGYIIEHKEDLYYLYSMYIDNLFNDIERGNNNVKK